VAGSGVLRLLTFTGSLLLTHNAVSLILPTGKNITTQPGDAGIFISLGSGNWKCLGYFPISGKATSVTADDIGLGNVENTALTTWEGSTNLDTVGVINTGVWHGTPVGPVYGGTGLSVYTEGDVIYADGANSLTRLPKSPTATRVLVNSGVNSRPQWDQVNLTNGVTGVLPTANGGSGLGSQTIPNPTGTTLTIDLSVGNVIGVNLSSASGNITMTLQNPTAGLLYFFAVTQGTTARTITFPTGTKQGLQGSNTWTSTGASKSDVINFYYNGINYVIVGTVPDIG
jgi:hypothetical protein